MTQLRVWCYTNIGSSMEKKFIHEVNSPEEAKSVISALARYQLTLPEKIVSNNAFGLEEFDPETKEWFEWCSEDGLEITECEEEFNQ